MSPTGQSVSSPMMPYLGMPLSGWQNRRVGEGGLFFHLGITALPVIIKEETVGLEMDRIHWRFIALPGIGYAFNGDVYGSFGAEVGEGFRPYGSIGIRFWPFLGDNYGQENR